MHSADCALLRRHSQGRPLPSGSHARCPGLQQLTQKRPQQCCQRVPQLFQPRAAVQAPAAPLEVKNFEGSSAGSAELSLNVAPSQTAKGLVHRYVTYVLQNARAGTASTKTRAEVRGGGQKPYQQKKTGRARQGSRRTPLRPGGGVIFGPKPRDWSIKMNKRERRLALATALQSASDSITVVEDVGVKALENFRVEDVADVSKRSQESLGAPKTKELMSAFQRWGVSPLEKTLLILDRQNQQVELAGRNVAKLHINTADALEVFHVLNADRIVIERSALKYIHDFYGKRESEPEVLEELPSEQAAEASAEAAEAPAAAAAAEETSGAAPEAPGAGAASEAAAEAPASPAESAPDALAEPAAAEGAETPVEAQSD